MSLPLNAWIRAPKGHKLIAQGIALGNYGVFPYALKGQKHRIEVCCPYRAHCSIATIPKAMPWAMCLQGFQPFLSFYISSMHLTEEQKKWTI